MNINKFTKKSIEAMQDCEKIAYDFGNQEIAQEHFLFSLIEQEDSLVKKLIQKMDIDADVFCAQLRGMLEQRTKVSGGQVYVVNDLNKVLIYS